MSNDTVLDRIECALAGCRQPLRVVRVAVYNTGATAYVHLELSGIVDLSDPRHYDAVRHSARGYAPEWAEGESWLGFRSAGGLFPLNPVVDASKIAEWRRA